MDRMEQEEDVVPSPMKPSSLEALEEELKKARGVYDRQVKDVNFWSDKVKQAIISGDEKNKEEFKEREKSAKDDRAIALKRVEELEQQIKEEKDRDFQESLAKLNLKTEEEKTKQVSFDFQKSALLVKFINDGEKQMHR